MEPTGTTLDAPDLSEFLRSKLDEVRRTNALWLAWLRLAVRTLTLSLYAWYLLSHAEHREAWRLTAVAVNVAHITVGVVVLVLLRRRRHVETAIVIGSASDFVVVSIAAWRAAGMPDALGLLSFFMGAYQFVLLFAALTLRTRLVAGLSAITIGYFGFLLSRLPAWSSDSLLILFFLAAFGVAVTFAGSRVIELASRTAAEEHGALLLRAHAEDLAVANAALHDARAQTEMLTRLVVHDLRSPLTNVISGLDAVRLALEDAPSSDPEVRETLAITRGEAWRIADMISGLLAIANLEQGMRARREPTDMSELLREVAAAHRTQAAGAGVSVEISVPTGLRASVDPELVRRSLENLLANALRHVPRGGRIALSAELAGGSLMLVERNSGPPVPVELRGGIFRKHVTGAAGGWSRTGLGLYFCHLAAESHGGRIELVERTGWNVSFEMELPGAEQRA